MYKEVLNQKQVELLPLVHEFREDFGLVGGTAIALQIGHRESIDFDLFSSDDFDNVDIGKKIHQKISHVDIRVIRDEKGEYTAFINEVKCTFFHYPFPIQFNEHEKEMRMPDLCTLAAMKAYTLGRRAKWKDYVDLYYIFKTYTLKEVVEKARQIFGGEFSEKNFREQLSYFDDIDHTEKVIFRKGFEIDEKKIKEVLIQISIG